MPDSPTSAQNTHKGRHYAFIKNNINDPFKTATLSRGRALTAAGLKIEPWYATAPATLHDKLKAANLKAWGTQNKVDQLFEKLQDVHSFAAPLLQAKLKERYGIENDVKTTYLRLYMPKDQPWYVIDLSGGVTARTVSLLDAALHNFAKTETVDADSQFITKPDKRGHFDVLPIKHKMTIRQFQALCRELDIGALYKKHLESYLLPGESVAEAVMKYKVTESQKDALTVAAQLALTTGDIQYDAYKLMLDLAQDKPRLLLNGKQMLCCDLSMMDTRLTGIVLLIHAVRDSRGIRRLIAYVPHDPDHPLKEYESTEAFTDELVRQLREDKISTSSQQSYRQFFSQFVDQQQRGHFFADLEQRLFTVIWHANEDPTDQRPAWRKEPVLRPRLQIEHVPLPGDYWRHAYQQKLNKILNDAREIAVATADTDSKARWAWWDNFKKIVSDIFNVALLIVTPFVPGLGELMMAYTAYQLTTEVVEGLVDLAEGQWQAVADHVIGVVTSVIQLAAFGAGAEIGSAFKLKLSPLVEGMKPVKLPDGKPALWHPDVAPYEQKNLQLNAASQPDRHGLHQHGHESILPLDGKLYSVEKASTHPQVKTHRIKHPERQNAYKPILEHNEHGAWLHEAENPADWEHETLMQRLGHTAERFSPTELEHIRTSSGTEHDELRRMHTDNSPPPPLLADTIKRFAAYDDAHIASANIRAGLPIDPQSDWFEPIATGLPGWPRERAIKVTYEHFDGYWRQYGNPAATDANTLTICQADLNAGRLPERLAGFLDDADLQVLLGREVPSAQRPQALRNLLADAVDARQAEVSKRLYQAAERSDKTDIRVLRQTFPEMPLPLAEKLITQASPDELQRIVDENRLPLRLKVQARELDFEATAARAYDGFYHDDLITAATERLALNTLKLNSDAFGDLRLEVRDGTYDGPLRHSVGPDDALTVRRLIRDEHGRYEVLDAHNRQLHATDDFYESILHALPAEKLSNVGYQHGQGRLLKLWIMEKSAAPAERRTVLAEPPIRPVATIETQTLVRGWPWFSGEKTPEQRVRQLYPRMTEWQAKRLIENLRKDGDPVDAIKRLESERSQLHNELQAWRDSYPTELDASGELHLVESTDYLLNGGRHIEERLVACFERKNDNSAQHGLSAEQGYALDLSTDHSNLKLDRWWKDLSERPGIKKHLDQITALKLDNLQLSADADGVLGSFPHLRQLHAARCNLTEVPSAIAQMHQLQDLDLSNNSISMTASTTDRLSGAILLRTLNLNNNPLERQPDVGRMYRLKELSLANTRIRDFPDGLFKVANVNKHRPRGFVLDMQSNPIDTLPEVTPGSDQAFILSRARFDTTKLPLTDKIRYGTYRQSAGLDFEQAYFRAVSDEIRHWLWITDEPFSVNPSAAFKKYREESWLDVMAEPGSDGLFAVIRRQRASDDYLHAESRSRLSKRVWELIDAAALDSNLREELFKQAREPENCRDGGAYLFNSMGMKVLVSKAYAEPTSAKTLDDNLARLARSAARLDLVGDIAREEISRQEQRHRINPLEHSAPDDLEVHMAYQTGLAERLGLPWQSEGMHYQTRSGVTQTMIDDAYQSILLRESGDGLVDGMIEPVGNDFWDRHLRKTHPTQYETNDRLFEEKPSLLDELRDAQADWANIADPAQMNPLARRIEKLADQLGFPQAEFFSGEPMSLARYDRLLNAIGHQRNNLSRRLTREALINIGHSSA
ncbi:dermonecrotic toxin domain-containing protein [Pseudomonas sp. MDT1-85]